MISTTRELNNFAKGCETAGQLLEKLIARKQIISESLARLVLSHI